ncbi:MAG: hypothetical protein J6P98_02140, partial [Clostridia bacterium]|nr:hypothetical protein [Clostridia bacterium]
GVKSSTSNWSVENSAVINYMACHDNNTIWDKLQLSNPDATDEERFLMNRLGIEIIMLAKGTPFFLAGEEMLRTKGGDSNSYNSSDEVNNIDWDALEPGSMVYDMRAIYRSLIAMRGANSFLTDPEVEAVCRVREDNGIEIEYMKNKKPVALAFINPNEAGMAVSVEAGLGVLLEGSTASASPIRTTTGSETVEGRSAMLLVMP